MNEITQRRSITADMAEKFGMETAAFESTIRATIFLGKGTKEEMATFLLVAKQYDLNPVTKEIYAFPNRGGIIPVVSVDGWAKLINSHPMMDGMEFVDHHDDKGELVSVTCSLWRKDRTRATTISEYLSECFRPTEPWKMKHRMLRHKALIQCARYAFGFAGIYDPDEGERIQMAQRLAPPPKATTLREGMRIVDSYNPDTGEINEGPYEPIVASRYYPHSQIAGQSETAGEVSPASSASGAGAFSSGVPVPEGAVVESVARDTIAPISLKEKGDAIAKNGRAALDQWIEEWMDPNDRAAASDDLLMHWRAIAKESKK